MVFKLSRVAGALSAVTAFAVACGGANSDRVGGAAGDVDPDPVVLTMAQVGDSPPPPLQRWADEVAAQSNGALTIEFANAWRRGEPDFEVDTIHDVQAGEVDLGWVGARALDRAGVTSFQPLLAPLLVDSHDLQQAVFESGIPDEMLAGLADAELVGLGILPGPLRKVLGVSRPFVTPADYEGAVVGVQDGVIAEQTMLALGATPMKLPGSADISAVDAYEQQMGSIAGNDYWRVAEFVSANVNLWPRPLVMFMNADAFAALSEDQQAVLRNAAPAATVGAIGDARADDANDVPYLCERGMTLVQATADDFATLRDALQPVYDQIAGASAENAAWLAEIEALKAEVGAPPDTAACPASEAASVPDTVAFPDGTPATADTATTTAAPATTAVMAPTDDSGFPEGAFVGTLTDEGIERFCGGEIDDFELTEYLTFEDGWLELLSHDDGTMEIGFRAYYTVVRDRIEFDEPGVAIDLNYRWTFDGTELVLSDLADDHGFCDAHFVWESHPWVYLPDGLPSVTGATVPGSSGPSN